MGTYVEYTIKEDGRYKYIVDDRGRQVFWLKDDDQVYSVDGKTKLGYLKWYKDDWYEIMGIRDQIYVKK